GRVAPGDHLGVDIRLAAVHLALLLARRGVDAQVVVERARAATEAGFRDHDPRVGVAEDAGVLLVPRRVRRDLAEVEVVARERRLQQDQAVRRGQAFAGRVEGTHGLSAFEADARHHAYALRFDEDPSLGALAR